MTIDLHNHTKKYSACSIISIEDMLDIYIKKEVDGICITEHNRIWNTNEQMKIKEKYRKKIKIFFGVEVSTDIGDILMFSKDMNEYDKLHQMITFFELCDIIDKNRTALIWAHPYRYSDEPDKFLNSKYLSHLDGVELYNGNTDWDRIQFTKNRFDTYGLSYTGGSDTHSKGMAVKYATEFENYINNQIELVDNLKSGKFRPVVIN